MTLLRRSLVDAIERVVSCVFFAVGLFVFGWQGPIILLGFWIEEVVAGIGIAIQRKVVMDRLKSRGLSCEGEDAEGMISTNALYGIFMALHLLLIMIFIAVDAKKHPGSRLLLNTFWGCLSFQPELIDRSILMVLGLLPVPFIIMWAINVVRGLTFGPDRRRATLKSLFESNRAAMMLPHISILLGGFALVLFPEKYGLAIGLLASKCICELILLPITKKDERESEEVRGE